MKNRKYADGDLPKIAYHISKSNSEKVDYFTKRHETKYGKLGANDINKIIDIEIIDENRLLIIINSSDNIKGIIYNIKKNKILEIIEK